MKKISIFNNIRERTGLKHFSDPKAFIEYSNDMQNVYKDIDEYNIDKEREILIVLDDMIADMISNKKLNSIVTELFTKIPNKRELQEIALNHSSDISAKDFINIYRECTVKPYSFLINDTTLTSDNPLRFRKNLFKHIMKSWQLMIRLEMRNYNMILIEKQPKDSLYPQAKFINMNILLVKIYYHLISNK